jgi:hypothetical protein
VTEERLHKLWLLASLGSTLAAGGIVLITPQGWGAWPLLGFAPGLACLPFSARYFLRWHSIARDDSTEGTGAQSASSGHGFALVPITLLLALPLILVAVLTLTARESIAGRFFALVAILVVPSVWIAVRLLFFAWKAGRSIGS